MKMFKESFLLLGAILFGCPGFGAATGSAPKDGENPADHLPAHIRRVTWFGERADWSHDGKRILFLEKTFGDVYEVDPAFFFLAEDGIRDVAVTGVQTCALPILIAAGNLSTIKIWLDGTQVFDTDTATLGVSRLDVAMVGAEHQNQDGDVAADDIVIKAMTQIGRASCRERVQSTRAAEPRTKKLR